MIERLADARQDIAQRLADAATNRRNPMHTPVVATADADVRVMVLRAFDAERWTLRFHTDLRAPKVAAVAAGGAVGALFYDRKAQVQIRIRGTARIESDSAEADAAWSESDNYARRCYLGEGPGAVSEGPTSGLPKWVEGEQPTDEQLIPARANFAVLLVQVESADWFSLCNTGHRRALFDIGPDGAGEGCWIAP